MNIAPLQPRGIVFEEVSIKVVPDENNNLVLADQFDFGGVNIRCDVGHARISDDQSNISDSTMWVSVDIFLTNETGKKAPYSVHVGAKGAFEWVGKKNDPVETLDLIVVNGASILYGAIREMVSNVTSRGMAGPLLLPSLSFIDNKPSLMAQGAGPANSPGVGAKGSANKA